MTENIFDRLYRQLDMEERPFDYSREYALWRTKQLKGELVKYITLPGRVLDVGGGTGLLGLYLPAFITAEDYINLDYSWEMLTYSARKGGLHVNASATQIPLADETIDYVVCSEVLEHVPAKSAVLEECWRVLRKRGWFLLSTPRTGWREDYKHGHLAPFYYFFTRVDRLWSIVKNKVFGILPLREERILVKIPDEPSDESWLRSALTDTGFTVIEQFRADNHLPWARQGEAKFWRWFADKFVDARRYGHCTIAICRK